MTLNIDPGAVDRAVQLTHKGEAYCDQALLASSMYSGIPTIGADRVARIAVRIHDRRAIGAAVDRLIDMLDLLEPDADLEPDLGWNPSGDLGASDDREHEDEHGGDVLDEPHDDDMLSGPDSEPSLGWTGHGMGCQSGEGTDDREWNNGSADERELCDGDSGDYDGGEVDAPIFIAGGGSVSQHEDGWRAPPAPERRTVPEISPLDPYRAPVGNGYGWNAAGRGNLPPEAFEGLIPEIARVPLIMPVRR